MRIDPNRVIFEMRNKTCPVCKEDQWCFFLSPKEYSEWDCPACRSRKDDGSERIQAETNDSIQEGSNGIQE